MSFLWLVPGTTAGIIPSYLLPPIIGDLMNEDKSQAGAPQTPELLPGSPYCVQAYEVNAGDTCASIAKQHGLFKEQVQIWSPVAKDKGCDSLPVGSRICVAVANEPEPLRWTPEKQAAANEAALKKLAEEEKKRKEDEEKARKKKQDEERKKKEEEERKKRRKRNARKRKKKRKRRRPRSSRSARSPWCETARSFTPNQRAASTHSSILGAARSLGEERSGVMPCISWIGRTITDCRISQNEPWVRGRAQCSGPV
ncbi:hypothetical protein OOU_Y34scaffold00770g14 [Pyricularia oryzae Y34]|uniref:LysM domain-containing protein n=1 Tax=Pyricularia oryzae (strain Y34) TaxID=1143189 RepID=A0AA97PH28_PYRO3|nr:hypothetical protein OOU_Y34scaffold00770g14 [Pyricularia oryzae Y34]